MRDNREKSPDIFWVRLLVMVFIVLSLAYFACSNYISHKSETMLELAEQDFVTTFEDTLTRMLAFMANAISDDIGTVRPLSLDEMRRYCRTYGVDEINLADTNGVWVAASIPNLIGLRVDRHPESAKLLRVFDPTCYVVAQPFRKSADEDVVRKYLAIEFDDRSGLIEIGYDLSRVAADFNRNYEGFVSNWHAADSHFYVVTDDRDVIFDCERNGFSRNWVGRKLSEVGIDSRRFPKREHTTFRIRIGGKFFLCRHYTFAGKRFITLLPLSEFAGVLRLVMGVASAVFLAMLVFTYFVRRATERRQAALDALERAERERRRQDMRIAQAIQNAAMPVVFPPYPRDLHMDVYAQMDPARDVGGDFYDFFYVGRDRLAFLVADVSGKGVSAAMFMMQAKATLCGLVTSMSDLGEAVAETNQRLCACNDVDMFVTCWVGVLDERTGIVRYVNAGHNPPYVRRRDGSLEALENVSGLFLGGMKDIRYKTFETRLEAGDLLFAFTDGVTEANNVLGEMFGEKRLEEALRGERGMGLSRFLRDADAFAPERVCKRVRAAVDAYAGDAAQFDDITLLALRFRGEPETVRLTVPARLESLAELSAFAEKTLDEAKCPKDCKSNFLIALDEIANNVASYSGSPDLTLEIEIARNPSVVRFRVIDAGAPWNPLKHIDPDITLGVAERAIGGLGILMVKKLMDDVAYRWSQGHNILTFRKRMEK